MLRILNDKLAVSTAIAKTQPQPQSQSTSSTSRQTKSQQQLPDNDLDQDDDLSHSSSSRQSINMRFTSQGIGNALSGLQSMTHTDGPEALQALAGYVRRGSTLLIQSFPTLTLTLPPLSSSPPYLRLVEHLEACEEEMSPMDLSNALFGLQGRSIVYPYISLVQRSLWTNPNLIMLSSLPLTRHEQ